jgi:hypothetical protein
MCLQAKRSREINNDLLRNNEKLSIEIKYVYDSLNQNNLVLHDIEKENKAEKELYIQKNNDLKISLEKFLNKFEITKNEKINLEFKLNDYEKTNLMNLNNLDRLKEDLDVELNCKFLNVDIINNIRTENEYLKNENLKLNEKVDVISMEVMNSQKENTFFISELENDRNALNLKLIRLKDNLIALGSRYDLSVIHITELLAEKTVFSGEKTVFLAVQEELKDARKVLIYMYINVDTYIRESLHRNTNTFKYIDTCICRCVYTYIFMYICLYVSIDTYSYLCVHTYIYLYINIIIYLHIYEYINSYLMDMYTPRRLSLIPWMKLRD